MRSLRMLFVVLVIPVLLGFPYVVRMAAHFDHHCPVILEDEQKKMDTL